MANANKTAALKQGDVRLIHDPVARHLPGLSKLMLKEEEADESTGETRERQMQIRPGAGYLVRGPARHARVREIVTVIHTRARPAPVVMPTRMSGSRADTRVEPLACSPSSTPRLSKLPTSTS